MLKPGDTFHRYTVEAAIGQGGMGRVYRAHDERLGRRVAIKVISEGRVGGDSDARLLREARAAAALDHPNAVAIFDVGEADGAPFIVMELVEGRTLRAAIGAGSVSVATRTGWLADAARALAAAHRKGLIHRDVKPENVMVRDDGVVKVLDFGIARRSGAGVDPNGSTQTPALATLTVEGVRLGTPVYMAPEQVRVEALDGRADQFSWGVVAYEILSGKLPWRGADDAFAVVASILTDPVDVAALDAAGVPPDVRRVVMRALEKRAEDRFASMDDLVRALDAALKGEPVPSDPRPKVAEAPAATPASATPASATPASATLAQKFSTEEVRDVLSRAIDAHAKKRGDARLGFDDLLAAAEEVGVDAESLREASRALRERDAPGEHPVRVEEGDTGDLRSHIDRDAWIRRRRLAFYRHAGIFVIVNAALLSAGMILGIAVWVLLGVIGWGIGLGIHGLIAMTSNEDDWAQEREGMRWWNENRRRRHELAMARMNERTSRRMEKGRRFEAVAERVIDRVGERIIDRTPAKVRVADTGRDRAAEDEAAAAEAQQEKQKRR